MLHICLIEHLCGGKKGGATNCSGLCGWREGGGEGRGCLIAVNNGEMVSAWGAFCKDHNSSRESQGSTQMPKWSRQLPSPR